MTFQQITYMKGKNWQQASGVDSRSCRAVETKVVFMDMIS